MRYIADCGFRIADSTSALPIRTPRSAIRNLLAGALLVSGCAQPAREPVTVTVPPGATFEAAVDSLAAAGVITRPRPFRLYARWKGLPGALKSGVYELRRDDDWSRVVRTLKRGRGAEVRWTVPEGLMLTEVADRARGELGIPRDSSLAAARDAERLQALGIRGRAASVEGYLFPTTYLVPVGIGARDLVRLMTREFVAQWQPEWEARLDTLRLTRHQVVTLASIIEGEVRYGPDRPYVSAVYHNRLQRGMPLQADPTVIYAYGRRLKRVWEKHLAVRSPYNTYLHPGLPPGPIGQPGRASLFAALYPARVPFLYFVAQPDGKHIFSTTYAEHVAAIRTVRRGQSAPRAPPPPGR